MILMKSVYDNTKDIRIYGDNGERLFKHMSSDFLKGELQDIIDVYENALSVDDLKSYMGYTDEEINKYNFLIEFLIDHWHSRDITERVASILSKMYENTYRVEVI